MRQCLIIAVMCFLVSACGLPPAVTIASYMVDSLLMTTSGKSSTDHLISLVSSKDCAMWRVARGDSICNPSPPGDPRETLITGEEDQPVALAQSDIIQDIMQSDVAQPDIGDSRLLISFRPADYSVYPHDPARLQQVSPSTRPSIGIQQQHSINRSPDTGEFAISQAPNVMIFDEVVSEDPITFPDQPRHTKVVSLCIGSFRDQERARRWRHRFEDKDARVVRVLINGTLWHRVLLSPPAGESMAEFASRFEQEMGLPFWLTDSADNTG